MQRVKSAFTWYTVQYSREVRMIEQSFNLRSGINFKEKEAESRTL